MGTNTTWGAPFAGAPWKPDDGFVGLGYALVELEPVESTDPPMPVNPGPAPNPVNPSVPPPMPV